MIRKMDDESAMKRAYEVARSARAHGNHPFGAILLLDGQVLLEAENTVVTDKDPTGHAETNLMRKLGRQQLSKDQLKRVVLVTSTEPCVMCCGAAYWARVRTIVYGFPEEGLRQLTGKDGSKPSLLLPCQRLYETANVLSQFEIRGPILLEEGKAVHGDFWETKAGH